MSKAKKILRYLQLPLFTVKYALWQNDYLYPCSVEDTAWYPYRKPHLWKTRIGFKTGWELAKIILL